MSVLRRNFLIYLGLGTYAALRDPQGSANAAKLAVGSNRPMDFFEPIQASTEDKLLLPAGYHYDLVCSWDDPLGSSNPLNGDKEKFGFNNDFLAYFPIDGRAGQANGQEGLLWVNHEYPDPFFVSGYTDGQKSIDQIRKEKLSVGGSVLYIKRDANGKWTPNFHESFTRRLTASYPEIEVTGPAKDLIQNHNQTKCLGTLANCSGGRTPWLTVLSCEENYPDYNRIEDYGYRWSDQKNEAINEEHFGWIVEVDPYDQKRLPMKHTALGRFKHENTAMRWDGPSKRLVVYMGDDEIDQYLYKYVSDEPYEDPPSGILTDAFRQKCSQLLQQGTLYVADFTNGRWLPLDLKNEAVSSKLRQTTVEHRGEKVQLTTMALVLLYAREAATALGATPLDRPEDCEVHPLDGTLYVALTNNTKRANFHGQIVRLIEENNNPEGTKFRFELFLTGGVESGLSSPDNLAFDRYGNLWVACDISSYKIGKGPYQPFGNNGLFVVPTIGAGAGDAYQFASGPIGCELTGPCFTDDWQTLFLSVQHPGEGSTSLENPTSRWPRGGTDIPRPAVVAISGFPWS